MLQRRENVVDNEAPDKNCVTLANGDCVGKDCMHNQPEPEPKPGLSGYKKIMRRFWTVQHKVVQACQHKFTGQEPRTNCQFCWFAYFNENGDFTKSLDELWRSPGGENTMVSLRGRKFVKMFLRFMSTVANWKADEEAKGLNAEGKSVQEPTRIGEPVRRDEDTDDGVDAVGEDSQ
jgi:hypothetical protein